MTSNPVFFSIIIPTYNRATFLLECVNSILCQRGPSLEIIVVDDGSTDNTSEVIAAISDPRLRYLKVRNGERGAARNRGKEIATGQYLNFFDSDDIFYASLDDVMCQIEKSGYPPVVYGSIDTLQENGMIVTSGTRPFHGFKDNILFNNFLACGSVFLKRYVANEFSFSEDRILSGSEDWELWLRIFANYNFVEMPVMIFKQRDHFDRSMRERDGQKVKARENLFAECISHNRNQLCARFSNTEINRLIADRYTLIALSLHVSGSKGEAFYYWLKSILKSTRVVQRRRFWAVAKKLIFPTLW